MGPDCLEDLGFALDYRQTLGVSDLGPGGEASRPSPFHRRSAIGWGGGRHLCTVEPAVTPESRFYLQEAYDGLLQDRRIVVASSGSTFSKMQREREKKERAAAKREKRQERTPADAAPVEVAVGAGESELSAGDLVRLVEAIHREYDEGIIDLDTFEEKKQALLARVRID